MRIGLLAGDPSGIGPEVASKLLNMPDVREGAEVVLIGDPEVFRAGASIAGVSDGFIEDLRLIESRLESEVPMARVSRGWRFHAGHAAPRSGGDSAQ